ncbi:hypothetical protein SERLA73DRAFT_81383 [Serpula lacrymans var. lacrymans S7.3]|uniref:Uncharacterized protein n=1 Tax=Serpula lacrymans var. lacrymans (strain S7.3) TaxID=936435 RepID=F8QKY9_SERL3|nr:hypothetical protein SERLA73DRAFT_81383 [Serpula lacrymans var. lacrymans S7.3]
MLSLCLGRPIGLKRPPQEGQALRPSSLKDVVVGESESMRTQYGCHLVATEPADC